MALCAPTVFGSIQLLPGGVVNPPISAVGGTIVADTGPVAWANGTISGTLETIVLSGDNNNPLHGYTFEYILKNSANSGSSLNRLSLAGWDSLDTYVGYSDPTPFYKNATTADREVGGNGIGFNWADGAALLAGQEGVVVVQTGGTSYGDSTAYILDTGAASALILAPVPEPTTMIAGAGALGLALLGIGRARRSSVVRIG